MALPDYQALMGPLLKALRDGKEHILVELVEPLAAEFQLSSEDVEQRFATGERVLANRLAWAATYLKQAGAIERPGRGKVRITSRGKDLLKKPAVDNQVLLQFPEFKRWKTQAFKGRSSAPEDVSEQETPQDTMEAGHQRHLAAVHAELLQRLLASHPSFFEELVVRLLTEMGLGAGPGHAAVVGGSRDGGVDGVIDQDALGLDAVYVQAKRYDGAVSPGKVRDFIGALDLKRVSKGVLITTGTFSDDARDTAERSQKRIRLIDGQELVRLCTKHGVGVTTESVYKVYKVDADFFEVA